MAAERRRLLKLGVTAGLLPAVPLLLSAGQAMAAEDPRPEFSAKAIDEVLEFYFGTRLAADDASITITAPLVTENNLLVPFEVSAPGASRMAVLFDGNKAPLIVASNFSDIRLPSLHGRARLDQTGFLHCYAMRGEVLGRATRRISVAGHWLSE